MSVAIYNPASHDAILTAAFLQTTGWRTFSSREVVDTKENKLLWLGLFPTFKHLQKQSAENSHEVYIRRHRSSVNPAPLLGTVHLSNDLFETSEHDYSTFAQEYGVESLQKTFLAQVAAIHGIRAPELHALLFMIREFKNPKATRELKANITLNIAEALNCLKTRTPFAPILLPARGKIDPDLERAFDVYDALIESSDRMLGYGSLYVDRVVTIGDRRETRRFVTTYDSENAWFTSARLNEKHIWTNIDVSSTGTLLTTNEIVELDYPVTNPVYVQI